jgi:hypothetical protein
LIALALGASVIKQLVEFVTSSCSPKTGVPAFFYQKNILKREKVGSY